MAKYHTITIFSQYATAKEYYFFDESSINNYFYQRNFRSVAQPG